MKPPEFILRRNSALETELTDLAAELVTEATARSFAEPIRTTTMVEQHQIYITLSDAGGRAVCGVLALGAGIRLQ